jgi:hypothetical protein
VIEASQWVSAAAAVQAEGFCMLMCVDRGAGAQLELWLRTNAGTVITCAVGDAPLPSLASVWPEARIKEREIHEMFGVQFDDEASHAPLLFPVGHALHGVHPMLKSHALRSRNETPWPGTKDPADSGGSPSRRKALPIGVVADAESFEGDFI